MRLGLMGIALALVVGVRAQDLAITNARIEVGDGQVIENGTILIRGDRILQVGAGINVATGTKTVDAKGLTVYPGFIDAYRSGAVTVPEAPASGTPPPSNTNAPATMWAGNRRGIRPELKASEMVDLKDLVKDSYANGITLAHVSNGGGMVRGSTAVMLVSETKRALSPSFGMELSFRQPPGGAGGPGGGGSYPGSLLGVVALVRQSLADAIGYAGDPKDAAWEALRPATLGQVPALFYVNSDVEIFRTLNLSQEFGLKPMIVGGRDAYRRAAQLKERGVAVILNADIGEAPTTKPEPDGAPEEFLKERAALWEERASNARLLAEAGVPFALGSDTGGADDFLANVRKLVKQGLPRAAALNALTAGAAKIFGLNEVGRVAVGQVANLAILDGDFAEDGKTVKMVVVGGNLVDLTKKEVTK